MLTHPVCCLMAAGFGKRSTNLVPTVVPLFFPFLVTFVNPGFGLVVNLDDFRVDWLGLLVSSTVLLAFFFLFPIVLDLLFAMCWIRW